MPNITVSHIMRAATLNDILAAPTIKALTFTRSAALRLEAGNAFYKVDASGRLAVLGALAQTHTRVMADASNPITLKSQWVKKDAQPEVWLPCPVCGNQYEQGSTCSACREDADERADAAMPDSTWSVEQVRAWVKAATHAGWRSQSVALGVRLAVARRMAWTAEDGTRYQALVSTDPASIEVQRNGRALDVPARFEDLLA